MHVLSSHEANVIAIATPGTVLDGSELCSFASCDSAGNVLLWKLSGADGGASNSYSLFLGFVWR